MTVEAAPAMPPVVIEVFSTWELVGFALNAPRRDERVKTYVHRKENTVAITRYVGARLVGHLRMTRQEFAQIGAISEIQPA